MKIKLPENVNLIISTLKENGFDAYAVGGCIRDSLLGREPNDWDITTSAKPVEVKTIFSRTIDTGIQHGTVTVLIDKETYEVTTYRIDGKYSDNRHPEEVTFTDDLKEDLRRRDFTINAMAYNYESGLVDIFGGQEDIQRKLIRAVGNPTERFDEDALRIMRAVRFAGQLGYEIEELTFNAGKAAVGNLKSISAERIQVELVKLMVSDNPQLLDIAYKMGITKVVLPEYDLMMETEQNTPHHAYTVGEHTLRSVCNIKHDEEKIISGDYSIPYSIHIFKYLRLAMLMHDMGKPICKITENGRDHFHGHPKKSEEIAHSILKRLKFDNKTIDMVSKLVLYHDIRMETDEYSIRKWINRIGSKEIFELLILVQYADTCAQSLYKRDEKLEYIAKKAQVFLTISENKDPLFIKDLKINGNDIISNNLAKGEKIGKILQSVLKEVLLHPEYNFYDKQMEIARKKAKEIQ